MTTPRTIAVGDIHGHVAALNGLFAAINPQADDTLVFLGDYVDRGPDSRGVLQRLIELSKILDMGHLVCIDTGCGFGGLLTALDVARGRIWQVDESGNAVLKS